MGVVYLAQQDNPRRQVAIKLMRQGITSRASRSRFHQEAELLARLAHPSVAQVYEAGMHLPPDATVPDQAIPFFAMEYVRGAKPLTVFAAANHLSIRDRVKLFIEVCRGVEHGHAQGVIHRDLKPANILVGDAGQPKIIDYGVAVCTDPQRNAPRHTETGQIVGTVQYMSPEQFASSGGRLDQRSDVYSLGVVLYELVCRRLPYDVEGRSFIDATRAILNQPPVPPRQHVATIDKDLETIILRALEKSRQARVQSVSELIAHCEKYLRGEPGDLSPVSWPTRAWTRIVDASARRFEWAVVAIVALVTILAGHQLDRLLRTHTNLNEFVLHAALTHAGRYAGGVPFGDVRLVSITPGTDFSSVEGEMGPEPPDFNRLYTVRPVYGLLLSRFAALPRRPSVVVLDIRFAADRPGFDDPLARGIRELGRLDTSKLPPRVDVICALASMQLNDRGAPAVASSLLDAGIRFGGPSILIGADGVSWVHPKVPLAIKNPHSLPIPGIALRAYISARNPGCEIVIEKTPDRSALSVSAHEPGVSPAAGVGRRRGIESIAYISTGAVDAGAREFGIDPEAVVPVYEVWLPSEDHIRSRDADLVEVLSWSDQRLMEEYAGKTVIIGVRGIPGEMFTLAGGRSAAGMEIHAAAIASLEVGHNITQGEWFTLPMKAGGVAVVWSAVGAVLGVAIGTLCARSLASRWVLILASLGCLLFGAWASMRFTDTFFNPVPAAIAVVLAAELAAFLYRARMDRREFQPWRFA